MTLTRRTVLGAGAAMVMKAAPRPLFNGRDLTGWTAYGHGKWAVEDGVIAGRFDTSRPGPGYLLTDEEFSDFRLDLEFWITRGGNSGVYVRQPHRKFGTRGKEKVAQLPGDGHEIQINYHEKKNLTGAVYNFSNATKLLGGEERWNRCTIQCKGTLIVVWIEGEEVNRYDAVRSARGALGFQVHGQTPHDDVARFRNVTIELI